MTRDAHSRTVVPSFYLYGEPPRTVGQYFLHLEDLADRSRPADWTIRSHDHENLSHVFVMASGAGRLLTDCGDFAIDPPSVLIVPARHIHALDMQPDASGQVLTIADAYLDEVLSRQSELAMLFRAPDRLPLRPGSPELDHIGELLARVRRELGWEAPGHKIAVEASLLALLVVMLRIACREGAVGQRPPSRDDELVAEFRALVDRHFRLHPSLEEYANRLRVTPARLRRACAKVAQRSPLRLIQDRMLLEAKRLLLYSNLTVSEAAYTLGYDDPAYFSRLFSQAVGQSPRAFRARPWVG